jgi:hypothetical protein
MDSKAKAEKGEEYWVVELDDEGNAQATYGRFLDQNKADTEATGFAAANPAGRFVVVKSLHMFRQAVQREHYA